MIKALLDGITREHLLQAIHKLDNNVTNAFAYSTHYDVLFQDQRYPSKAVVGLAAEIVLGHPVKPKDFTGGIGSTCFRVLQENGFTIVSKLSPSIEASQKRYWWVNHKQTVKKELNGGYLWSPQTKSNGNVNLSYENLRLTKPKDIVFSYAGGIIKAIGLVTKECQLADRPEEFGELGYQWGKEGYLVTIDWTSLSQPLVPKDHLSVIAPLLPLKHSPIRPTTGGGNQGCYLAAISPGLASLLLQLIGRQNATLTDELQVVFQDLKDLDAEAQIHQASIPQTVKDQLIKARVGQGIFRTNVSGIEQACRLTGITNKALLIASHIKPWRISTNEEKLDKYNGLLLSPHVDKLFDKGWISFSDEGDVLISNITIQKVMDVWGLNYTKNVGSFTAQQKQYVFRPK
ncbi:HNH endonuclease [Spirosoma pollinicola]|uniref:HNH endonuclease n=1 Tax=Spirosoma pollinicola TaxID=2057025 RepID=A0A2K8Z0Q5_9BACT|nr:HNH endonuclease signature motif containing protein [Spirosoma pollinicola]AUD03466.1 HNH endonuclease [Spirosoma pollinicola]